MNKTYVQVIAAFSVLMWAKAVQAQTITVSTLEDVVDFGGTQQVANLPGSDGRISFREALAAANNTSGPQTITFAIPQNEWWLISNIALLRQEQGIFRLDDDGTTVDFSSQARTQRERGRCRM